MSKENFIKQVKGEDSNKTVLLKDIVEWWCTADIDGDPFDLLIDIKDTNAVFSFEKKKHITSPFDNGLGFEIGRLLGLDIQNDVDYQVNFAVHSRVNATYSFAYFISQQTTVFKVNEVRSVSYEGHKEFVIVKLS